MTTPAPLTYQQFLRQLGRWVAFDSGTVTPDPDPGTPDPTVPANWEQEAMLPFLTPDLATRQAIPNLTLTHYFATDVGPLSSDDIGPPDPDYTDKKLMPPGFIEGAGQKWETDHRSYGGLQRDRAIRRPHIGTGYKAIDRQTDVQRMVDAKLDGCVIDVLNLPGSTTFDRVIGMYDAVVALSLVGKFYCLPMLDYTGGAINGASIATIVSMLKTLANHPASYWIGDRFQVTFFKPEKMDLAYYTNLRAALLAQGIKVDFTFCYVAPMFGTNGASKLDAEADRHSRWGDRDPDSCDDPGNTNRGASQAIWNTFSKPYMAPVSPGDVRPNTNTGNNWHEQQGTRQLRVSWDAAIYGSGTPHGRADWVQIPTWNDWSETANICPSRNNGWVLCDLTAYYVGIYKTGAIPKTTKDCLYLAHRTQFVNETMNYTASTFTNPMEKAGGTPKSDIVEVVAFVTNAANTTVEITTGGVTTTMSNVVKGMNVFTVPLKAGGPDSVRAVMKRGGVVVPGTRISSPWAVSHTAEVQDPTYRMGSSLRGWDASYPSPIPDQTLVPVT